MVGQIKKLHFLDILSNEFKVPVSKLYRHLGWERKNMSDVRRTERILDASELSILAKKERKSYIKLCQRYKRFLDERHKLR